MRLRHTGTGYSGYDPVLSRTVTAGPGEVVEFSEANGERVQCDYPGQWEVVVSPPPLQPQDLFPPSTRPNQTKPKAARHTK